MRFERVGLIAIRGGILIGGPRAQEVAAVRDYLESTRTGISAQHCGTTFRAASLGLPRPLCGAFVRVAAARCAACGVFSRPRAPDAAFRFTNCVSIATEKPCDMRKACDIGTCL